MISLPEIEHITNLAAFVKDYCLSGAKEIHIPLQSSQYFILENRGERRHKVQPTNLQILALKNIRRTLLGQVKGPSSPVSYILETPRKGCYLKVVPKPHGNLSKPDLERA